MSVRVKEDKNEQSKFKIVRIFNLPANLKRFLVR